MIAPDFSHLTFSHLTGAPATMSIAIALVGEECAYIHYE